MLASANTSLPSISDAPDSKHTTDLAALVHAVCMVAGRSSSSFASSPSSSSSTASSNGFTPPSVTSFSVSSISPASTRSSDVSPICGARYLPLPHAGAADTTGTFAPPMSFIRASRSDIANNTANDNFALDVCHSAANSGKPATKIAANLQRRHSSSSHAQHHDPLKPKNFSSFKVSKNINTTTTTTNALTTAIPSEQIARLPAASRAAFVSSLIESAALLIEEIWPSARSDDVEDGSKVLALRDYIKETLRRSRSSYSTLQVALYYLVILRPKVERPELLQPSMNSLHCGRRAFLASLILANKYLQDKNYSSLAWSKICGLPTTEINSNEIAFLKAIDWNLHVPEHVYEQWSQTLLASAYVIGRRQSYGTSIISSPVKV
ncbi:hypothetical protein V1514DRAFT_357780 [Lipomyces japonicus]|uniref:uncharacterized protein n=1 Tax=Lipomyces japonicus TaxID=56871 RepID=UPI0034CF8D49